MTVDTIERLKELVDEVAGTPGCIVSAWEYTNAYNNRVMFAAFTMACNCDIFESPAVLRPKLIYRSGRFIGEYDYLNDIL